MGSGNCHPREREREGERESEREYGIKSTEKERRGGKGVKGTTA